MPSWLEDGTISGYHRYQGTGGYPGGSGFASDAYLLASDGTVDANLPTRFQYATPPASPSAMDAHAGFSYTEVDVNATLGRWMTGSMFIAPDTAFADLAVPTPSEIYAAATMVYRAVDNASFYHVRNTAGDLPELFIWGPPAQSFPVNTKWWIMVCPTSVIQGETPSVAHDQPIGNPDTFGRALSFWANRTPLAPIITAPLAQTTTFAGADVNFTFVPKDPDRIERMPMDSMPTSFDDMAGVQVQYRAKPSVASPNPAWDDLPITNTTGTAVGPGWYIDKSTRAPVNSGAKELWLNYGMKIRCGSTHLAPGAGVLPSGKWQLRCRTFDYGHAWPSGTGPLNPLVQTDGQYAPPGLGATATPGIPYGSGGWRYLIAPESDTVDRSAAGFDDSAWLVGAGPFGDTVSAHASMGWITPEGTYAATSSTIWIRRSVVLNPGQTVTLGIRYDGNAAVYWNGILVGSGPDGVASFEVTGSQTEASNILAVRVTDDASDPAGDWTYLDVSVTPLSVDGYPAVNTSPWSESVSIAVSEQVPAPIPVSPINRVAVPEGADVALTWRYRNTYVPPYAQAQRTVQIRSVGSTGWTTLVSGNSAEQSFVVPSTYPLNATTEYQWRVSVTDADGVVSDYSAIASFWVVPAPVSGSLRPVPSGTIDGATLGCGTHRAFVYRRGGLERVGELTNISALDWNRVRDDISDAKIVVSGWSIDCGNLLAQLQCWAYEVVIFRDNGYSTERVWEGPITLLTYEVDSVTIQAKDVMGYAYRRIIKQAMNDRYNNSTVVARATQVLQNVFAVDDPNVLAYLTPLVRSDDAMQGRDLPEYSRTAFEEVDDMAANQGLDYTCSGRSILLWGTKHRIGTLPEFRDEDLGAPPIVSEYGMSMANGYAVSDGSGVWGEAVRGRDVSGNDPTYGLVELLSSTWATDSEEQEGVYTEENKDKTRAKFAKYAERSIADRYPPPVVVRVPDNTTLNPGTVLSIQQLIPGVVIPLRSTGTLRSVADNQKLDKVQVTEASGKETISITLSPFSRDDVPIVADPLTGLLLRGTAEYHGQATAPLPAGAQIGDLVVVSTTGGNYNGGSYEPRPYGANPDPRLTGYQAHRGGEQYWGTLTNLNPLPLTSVDSGPYGASGYVYGQPGVAAGTCTVLVAVYGDMSGQPVNAVLHSTGTRGEYAGNVTTTLTSPATDGPVLALSMDTRGYGYSPWSPPECVVAEGSPAMTISHDADAAPFGGIVWTNASDYQVYDQTLTVLRAVAVASPDTTIGPDVVMGG